MFKIVENNDELIKAFSIRSIVFIHEQKCPYSIEVDGLDFNACHIIGEEKREPFACGRIRFFSDYAKLERIAVRKEWRGRNLGHELVLFMIDAAEKKGFKKLKMHAQTYAVPFYEKLGFKAYGDVFMEAGIEHTSMVRQP